MHPEIQKYIDRMTNGESINKIDLSEQDLLDSDIQHLFVYFQKNPGIANGITSLNLGTNKFETLIIPKELIALEFLNLGNNKLTSITIPKDLVALSELYLNHNQLTDFTIPKELVALKKLNAGFNKIQSITIPKELIKLEFLNLEFNKLSSINIPKELVALIILYLSNNQLPSLIIPKDLVKLAYLRLDKNQLTDFVIPKNLAALTYLDLSKNKLTRLIMPKDLTNLRTLNIGHNQLNPISNAMLEVFAVKTHCVVVGLREDEFLDAVTLEEHFKKSVDFQSTLRSTDNNIIKQLLLLQLQDLVEHNFNFKFKHENTSLQHINGTIQELFEDRFCILADDGPQSEITDMREAFSFAFEPAIEKFTDALSVVNDFAESDTGKALLAQRKKEYDDFIPCRKLFVYNLLVAFNNVLDNSENIFEYNKDGLFDKSDKRAEPCSKAFYISLQNILAKYNLPKDLITPQEMYNIIEPTLVENIMKERNLSRPKP